jgi:hypothetical protein
MVLNEYPVPLSCLYKLIIFEELVSLCKILGHHDAMSDLNLPFLQFLLAMASNSHVSG